VQRIVLTRPAVEAGERLGFLPGDLSQKVDPYLRPLYDALYDLMGFDQVQKAFERQAIEIAPLAFMRGRTLNNAFVILDEAQNTTPEQMKMFLTRIGFGARRGHRRRQPDRPAQGQLSGLIDAERVLRRVKGIAICRFTSADVVRHPLVARIVDAYDAPASAAAWHGTAPSGTRDGWRCGHDSNITRWVSGKKPYERCAMCPSAPGLSLQFAPLADATPSTVPPCRATTCAAGSATPCAQEAEITVRIVDTEEGRALNRDYRHKDYATNVLTFDYSRVALGLRRPGAVRPGGGARSAREGQEPAGALRPPAGARHAARPGLGPRNQRGRRAGHGSPRNRPPGRLGFADPGSYAAWTRMSAANCPVCTWGWAARARSTR
jgi:hypothetical protein